MGTARSVGAGVDASTASILTLSFVAGLGPLVRPEMAIPGAAALMMIVLSAGLTWKIRTLIVVVAGLVPVGYQIWRMGYYALPYPNTAVSKDAGGAKWAQGFAYLWNLVGPYLLWLPLLFLLIGALLLVWRSRADTPTATADQPARRCGSAFSSFCARRGRLSPSFSAVG